MVSHGQGTESDDLSDSGERKLDADLTTLWFNNIALCMESTRLGVPFFYPSRFARLEHTFS